MADKRRTRALATTLLLLTAVLCVGCSALCYTNTAPFIERHIRASDDPVWVVMFKCSVLYPARDILTLEPLWRVVFGDEAWNAAGEGVADGSFYTERRPEELTPEAVARGACTMPPPQPPIRIEKVKRHGASSGFTGCDATGRRFLFKLDHPDYPEVGTSAEIVGSRILWALGYNVPPIFLVRIEGTGDGRFDGQRATAALFLEGVQGHFHFDWFRYRREVRALRLASAWIDDTDRVGSNTLVVVEDGQSKHYLIDFNSCLGSWQGRPKEPWRGRRHAWDLFGRLLCARTLAAPGPEPQPLRPVAQTVGRFSAAPAAPAWRPQVPNTAFDHMDRADRRWMAARIRRLGRAQITAAVGAAELSMQEDVDYLIDVLLRRRAEILAWGAPAPGDGGSHGREAAREVLERATKK